jgi:hypothetical protein
MKIVSKIFSIKLGVDEHVSLEFIENYFNRNAIKPVRWAIVEVKKNIITLCAALIEENV